MGLSARGPSPPGPCYLGYERRDGNAFDNVDRSGTIHSTVDASWMAVPILRLYTANFENTDCNQELPRTG